MPLGVMNRTAKEPEHTARAGNYGPGFETRGLKRRRQRNDLEHRPRLIGRHHGQILAPMRLLAGVEPFVWIVGRIIRKREYLAVLRIDGHYAAVVSMILYDRLFERLFSNVLNRAVDRQTDVLARPRLLHDLRFIRIFVDIHAYTLPAGRPCQLPVQLQLDSRRSLSFCVYISQYMRGQLAVRIIAQTPVTNFQPVEL